jgi:hypothetical protein
MAPPPVEQEPATGLPAAPNRCYCRAVEDLKFGTPRGRILSVHDHRPSRRGGRIDRRRAVAAVATCVLAGAGLATSTALAGGLRGVVALTTTIVPDPPPATTPLPKPDPPPLPKPPPPPPPRHVSPPPPPPVVHVSPPPPVVHVSPPPPPPAPVTTYSAPASPPPAPVRPLVLKRPAKPKPHRVKRHHRPRRAAPVYVSRGSGGPARSAPMGTPRDPLRTVQTELVAAGPAPSNGVHAGLFLALLAGCGLLLVGASLLPAQALRPAHVHSMLVAHRIDIGLIGVSLLMIGAVLWVLAS